MQLANGRILTDDFLFERHDVLVQNDRITQITEPYYEGGEECVIDAEGGYVLPGFVDLCVPAEEDTAAQAEALARQGVFRYLLAARPGQPLAAGAAPLPEGALGLRLQAAAGTTPAEAALARSGLCLVEVDPAAPGAAAFVRRISPDVRVCLAGTSSYDQARIAFACGAKQVTGFPAALDAMTGADPGLLGAACESGCLAELCPQAPGLHPAALRMAFQLFGPERICLVSAGAREQGGYTLADAVRSASWFGVPLSFAVRAATANPAQALGLSEEVGSVSAGKRADLVIWDLHDLSLRTVIWGGKVLYDKGERMSLGG